MPVHLWKACIPSPLHPYGALPARISEHQYSDVLQIWSVLPINCSCARQAGPPRQARPHKITCALHRDAQGACRDVEEKLEKLVWGGRPCAGRQLPRPLTPPACVVHVLCQQAQADHALPQ